MFAVSGGEGEGEGDHHRCFLDQQVSLVASRFHSENVPHAIPMTDSWAILKKPIAILCHSRLRSRAR